MGWFGGDKTGTAKAMTVEQKKRYTGPPLAPSPTMLGAPPPPPEATQARSSAIAEAMKAALRQRKKGAAGAPETVLGQRVGGSVAVKSVLAVKTLLGS
jgi:hypothetical protein